MASLRKRGKTFYIQYSIAGKVYRRSLETDSYQVGKEKVRPVRIRPRQGERLPPSDKDAHCRCHRCLRRPHQDDQDAQELPCRLLVPPRGIRPALPRPGPSRRRHAPAAPHRGLLRKHLDRSG